MALIGFEHVGMTVNDLDRTLAFYVELLGLTLVVRRMAADGATEMCFLDTGSGMLEIVCPAAGALPAEDVPPGRAGMRHLTFAFDDIAEVYDRLEKAGVVMLEPPRPAFNSDMVKRVAFCRDPDGIVIELSERGSARGGPRA